MSLWDEPNEDAYSVTPEAAATGPRVGFLDAFETAYNTQVRTSAMYGIEKAFHELENEQIDTLRRAGIEDFPQLSDDAFGFFGLGAFSGDYEDVARFYQDGGTPELGQKLSEYDRKIDDYKKKYPDLQLRTSRDLWDEVRNTAREYDRRSQTERNTWGGALGGFAGAAVGGLNVESDPWNFATIPLNVGRTALTRILGQGGAQGVVEGINQITGVQEQRRLIGLEHGFADGLSRVAGAAIGGAVLQGTGEALVYGARRFFRNAPGDPAPAAPEFEVPASRPNIAPEARAPEGVIPADQNVAAEQLIRRPQTYTEYLQEVSPWSLTRAGRARTVLDMDNVKTQLDDWAGPDPAVTTPKTDTAITQPRNDFVAQPNIFDRVADKPNLDVIARQVDPDAFRVYDKLADENETYRRWLQELAPQRAENAKLADINRKLDDLNDKLATRGKMKAKKIAKQIADLTAERERVKQEVLAQDTPDMAKVRAKLMRNDERMREMAPVVSRAYARAQNKWDNTAADRAAIRKMTAENKKTVQLPEPVNPILALPRSLYEKAPILQQQPRVADRLKADADAADVATAVLAKQTEDLEPVMEAFRADVARIAKETEKAKEPGYKKPEVKEGELPPDQVIIPGYKEPLHLDNDKITVPNEDGNGSREISLRQMMLEQDEIEADAKAVQSCSIQ